MLSHFLIRVPPQLYFFIFYFFFFADNLTGLVPKGFLQSILHLRMDMFIVIILMFLLFLIMYRIYIQPNTKKLHILWLKLLFALNKNGKEGSSGDTV